MENQHRIKGGFVKVKATVGAMLVLDLRSPDPKESGCPARLLGALGQARAGTF